MKNAALTSVVPIPESEGSILTLLRKIKDNTIPISSLSIADQRSLVEHLTAEGYSIPEIAEILKKSDRTISRYRKAIKQANALRRDPKLDDLIAGQLVIEAENSRNRLRRFARDPAAIPRDKIESEQRAFQILDRMIGRLQSMGHVSTATHETKVTATNRAEIVDPSDLQAEFHRLVPIGKALLSERPQLNLRIAAADRAIKALVNQQLPELCVQDNEDQITLEDQSPSH